MLYYATHLVPLAFIRGLLENVGVEISPIRLIRRIKNGLEIPGLKDALIKILQDFHLQISLLEGCQTIMDGDSADLSRRLQQNQTSGFFLTSMLVKLSCMPCKPDLKKTHKRNQNVRYARNRSCKLLNPLFCYSYVAMPFMPLVRKGVTVFLKSILC
jgi:hypothetical protein